MIELLKKYRYNIIVLLILTGLLLFFIPNEESRYLQPDFKEIKGKSISVLLWAELILFAVLLLFGLKQVKKIKDIFYLIARFGFIGLTFFFVFNSIFLSMTLFLNKLSKNKTVEKTYTVVYVDNNSKSLLLLDKKSKSDIQADQLIKPADNLHIKVADTLVVSFKKGLLGFNFDPTIKAINNTAAHIKYSQ